MKPSKKSSPVKHSHIKYVVMKMHKTIEIEINDVEHIIPLVYAEGMIGTLPVFDTQKEAEEWADGTCLVMRLQMLT